MTNRKITQLEFSMIDGKVQRVLNRIGAKEKGFGFLYMSLETLFPRSDEEISSLITDGGNDRGADAIHIREEGGSAYISIVQSKYAQSVKNAGKNFPGSEIDKLISLITDVANRTDGLLNSVNSVLAAKINDIWRLIEQGKTIFFRIFLVSNTLPLIDLEKQRLSAFCRQYDMVSFEEIPFWTITSLLSSDSRPREDGVLDCIDVQKFERIDCDIRGLIANVDAASYIKMISSPEGDSIKRHLFDENIRGYLGLEGGFNRQIQNSALSDDNHLFWYLNNGITIIAKDFSHQPVRGSKIKLSDFQIVNGAQTSYSLYNAFKKRPEKIGQVILLVKIFASSRGDISEKIAIATNSQARIAPRDLKANDQIQKKIGAVFDDNGLLYERKKNQFETHGNKPKVDSLKLGQAIVAYHLEEPHQAKTVSDEIFGNQYSRVFSESLDANYLVRVAKLYMYVSEYRDDHLITMRGGNITEGDNEFIGYAQWHLMYCMKLLANANGLDVPPEDQFDTYISQAHEIISKIAKEHHTQSYYRVFRSAKTKELIQRELGIGQLQFEFA
ncbi:AIPR family protein [Cribrihabitans neustonicus]|uniref:AIPR family protein n=1 Tax=Cribrihabitans neustonicus TaxID=1429085 RepID=UPI003B58C182